MNDFLTDALSNYRAILAPFLMLTSCATLVWALQNRFSRVYHAIRTLVANGHRDNIDYSHSLDSQIACLKRRALYLRNSISGLYLSMGLNLATVILLTLAFSQGWNLQIAIVSIFLLGLFLVCGSLVAAVLETSRSYETLNEEATS